MIEVSVIIATYNYGKFILEAIESVFQQTFINWELIIVDDGSADGTSDIVKPYLSSNKVKYIFQENKGLSIARNVGIKASSGKYIQFLDADDLIHHEKLKIQSQYLENHKEVDVVLSDYFLFEEKRDKIIFTPPSLKDIKNIKINILKGNFIVVNSPLSRKKAIEAIGGFDETLKNTEDWDLWLRMISSGMVFGHVNERLAFVRVHPNRMSLNRLRMFVGRYTVIKKNLKNIPMNSIYWDYAKRCFIRSKLAIMREYLFLYKFKDILKIIKDKPYFVSYKGFVDFIIETILILKNFIRKKINYAITKNLYN